MPRKAREKSSTGIYHVMFRGINKETIFHDNRDHEKFIHVLKEYMEPCDYEIYAYCLMKNHVHLLMKEGSEDLGIAFRRIGAKYVYWYNKKYDRVGHLFQDRYKSEVVEDQNYFLTVLRYIHQNPIKAGIVNAIEIFPWSSYSEYIGRKGICNIQVPLKCFSQDQKEALKLFKEFNKSENDDKCLTFERPKNINDTKAKEIIEKLIGIENPKMIQNLEPEKRDKAIRILKEKGLSIRQIERLTEISFSIIRRA